MGSPRIVVSSTAFVVSSARRLISAVTLILRSYNSALYSSIAVNDYWAISVSESIINDKECYNCDNITGNSILEFSYSSYRELPVAIRVMWEKARQNELEKLSNADCIRAYADMLQTKRRNVLLVTSDDKAPDYNASTIGGSRVYGVSFVSSSDANDSGEASNIYGKSETP